MFDLRRWLQGFRSDVGGPPRDTELLKEGLSRRGLLGLFAGAAVAVAIDPERAVWVPGKKLISIPNAHGLYLKLIIANQKSFYGALTESRVEGDGRGGLILVNELVGLYARGVDTSDCPAPSPGKYGLDEKTRPFRGGLSSNECMNALDTPHSPAPSFENILTACPQGRNGRLVPEYAGGKC